MKPKRAFEQAIREAARQAFGVDLAAVPLAVPPSAELGDFATPVCFELAKTLRRPPRALAVELAAAFRPIPPLARVEVAGAGYLNGFVDRSACLKEWLAAPPAPEARAAAAKVIVEHTNINPNKAAHIGHLRNAVLGDTLYRCLRWLGWPVEVQNYIDDTGVQVADLVVGFHELRGEDLDAVRERYAESRLREQGLRFDYLAWDLYAEVTRWYEQDPARRNRRDEVLAAMEHGGNPLAELAAHVAQRMVEHHLRTMERIGVRYDLLPRESDILALHFWNDAFTLLRERGAIHTVDSGKNQGCWVMDLPGAEAGAGEDQKIIVRSNGTVTYVGKDIAYQMWKFGLLGRDFLYRPFEWRAGPPLYGVWSTAARDGVSDAPRFGHGATVYNVIDTRQSYLQRVVTHGLRSLGFEHEAERSVHFAYEMVALTPASIRALFPELALSDDEAARPYLEMSGRKGLGVKADDLVDALLARAESEVRRRNPDTPDARIRETARRIGVGALRYYMLRFTRNRVVAFDLDDALAFEGETGPYLQYSVVRAKNVLAKLAERFGPEEVDPAVLAEFASLESVGQADAAEHWTLPLLLSRVEESVTGAVDTLELAGVAKHAYILAQAFSSFYHRYPVAQESDVAIRRTRAAIVRLYHDGMVRLLDLMGIEVPERM